MEQVWLHFQIVNNKYADQAVRMRSLVCAFVVGMHRFNKISVFRIEVGFEQKKMMT